ncbi:peptidase domain-containing ABC transporter [Amycolatopsis sp. 195334CR]|uniref:peptidase domain-containing ABC transporter n=1 Tax=Amycolatopsis sp. 195334CR TaxID=2814588 RepID=UPI001A907CF4|nr:peptidase domain-containing ABC transporter [Amycolatopsis sp. 195334CR]MBN6033679.1 peptidase domain-containing ABC transporter [Amycolatopsis sp. 195334CR]
MSRAPKVPVLLQDSIAECGLACLAMVLTHHGQAVTVQELRAEVEVGRDGLSAATLGSAAQHRGLLVEAYRAEPDALAGLAAPLILHWKFSHFVVLEHLDRETAVIVDPADGRRKLDRAEFDRAFTGVALELRPGPDFRKQRRPRRESLRFLLGFLPKTPSVIGVVLVASVLISLLGLAPALVTRYLIDEVAGSGSGNAMVVVGSAVLALVASTALLGYLRREALLRLRSRIDLRLMTRFLDHLFRLPYPYFQLRTSGDILTRVSSSMMLREALTSHTLSLLLDSCTGLLYVALLWTVSPLIAGIVAGAGFLHILVAVGYARRAREASRQEIAAMTIAQSQLVESLTGIESLKATGSERTALDRWEGSYRTHLLATLRQGSLTNAMEGCYEVIRIGTPLVLLWAGTWQVLDGDLSLGTLIAANSLAGMALLPLGSLSQVYQALQTLGVHIGRLRDVLAEEPEPNTGVELTSFSGRVQLRDVSFRHARDAPPILTGIDLDIEPGSTVAIVGATGSGKSTLARLILGLYQPTTGQIRADGVPLPELNPRSLRSRCGVVVQDPACFSGDLLDNIRIHQPEAALPDVVRAAQTACLHEEIQHMPLGYRTTLGERGHGLSGGQRQRLAIARALLPRPALLVLDEATSHLDVRTEAKLHENLRELRCTSVIVAHRLSTVRDADVILVLDNGRIAERGRHDELLALGGTYTDLVRRQLREPTAFDENHSAEQGIP